MIDRPYIKRVSILGGEPLADKNLENVLKLVNKILILFHHSKKIWLYTGYTFEECLLDSKKYEVIKNVDILVDGRYVDNLRDITLKWCGSSNQRVINIQETLKGKDIILKK